MSNSLGAITVKQVEATDTPPLPALTCDERPPVRCTSRTVNSHANPGSPVPWPEPHADSHVDERTPVSSSRLHDRTEGQRRIAGSVCFMLAGWLDAGMGV